MKIRLLIWSLFCSLAPAAHTAETLRPNILWLTSEDHGPEMGCYGDALATTPHVDRLAAHGMIYTRAWSGAPVCAPARTAIISGMYPGSTGSEHMRSLVPFPAGRQMFPQFLRAAGYYCSNNAKEDYNLAKPGQVWDESSRSAHWRKRQPGQPFFAVFNSEKSHESKIRVRPHALKHDPSKVRVPAYHPDTPEVRQDWAQYYDGVTAADADAGARLKELEEAGLAEDTIVIYFGDHGSGMPRSKRWPYHSGLHVPLVIYFPEKFRHLAPPEYKPGGKSDRLITFVDLAPTMLSLAGVQPPEWMHGRAFAGRYIAPAPAFAHGYRARMDERYDLVRSVTDGRFVYVRNYMPHKIYGQHLDYMFQTPTTRVWKKLHDDGKLNAAQSRFWREKPAEELYDLQNDRDEVNNLAGSAEHAALLQKLRQAHREHEFRIRDVSFLPEADMFARAEGGSPYDSAQDEKRFPFRKIFETAELASDVSRNDQAALRLALKDADAAVRYWAALGFLMRGRDAVLSARDDLRVALDDSSSSVRIAAAEALGRFGADSDLRRSLDVLMELAPWGKRSVFESLAALNAIDALGPRAASVMETVAGLPNKGPAPDARYSSYIPRLLDHIAAQSPAK